MKLDDFQNLFYKAVFLEDESSKQQLNQYIKAPKNLSFSDGLNIYRGSILGQLCQTLESIYPVCYRLLGEDFFYFTAFNYVKNNPSLSPDLGDYGANFANFLANFEPVKELIYLPNIAMLEWCYDQVFKGENNPELDLQSLHQISPENWTNLIFYLPKNSFLLESCYPIHRIWEVNQPDYQGDEIINLNESGIKIFLWRENYNIRLDFPDEKEWELLKFFQQNQCLETILASQSDINLDYLLPLFVQKGWLVNFSLSKG